MIVKIVMKVAPQAGGGVNVCAGNSLWIRVAISCDRYPARGCIVASRSGTRDNLITGGRRY